MRQLSSFLACATCTALAMACGPPAASSTKPTPAGEFRVLIPARPSSLNPNIVLDEVALVIGRSLFNQLLTVNESGRLLPELAESWTVSDDGLAYTFHLRRDVRWHDGVPFSSADVQWTLQTMAKEGFSGMQALSPVASIDAPDATTIVITLQHAWAPFAADLAAPGLSILPRHVYQGSDWSRHPANDRPIGTGPFKFGRWLDHGTLVLDANTDYFRSGPYVERLIFETATAESITERLLGGEADYSITRPSIDLQTPPPPLVARTLPTSGRYYLAMNLRRPPFGDVRVRRGMAMTIDRLAIVSAALHGLGAPAVGWYTPDVEWAYNSAVRVPDFDRAEAQRLLDAAGYPRRRGTRFAATLVVPNSPPMRDIADHLRSQFADVGIEIRVERVGTSEWPRRILRDHAFDLTIVAGGQGPDPDQLRRRFAAASDSGAYIGYDDPAFLEAVDRGARVVSLADRAAAYHRAQEILARDVPFIPIAESVKVVVHHQRVTGMPQLEARGLVGFFDFSLVKVGARAATSR